MSLSIPRNHLQVHHWTWWNIAYMSAWVEEGNDEVQQLGRQVQQWLLGHCQLTRLLGKPEILEEERRRGRISVVFTDSCQQDFFCEWTMLLLAGYKGKLTIGPNKCRLCNYNCICKNMTLISGVSISLWFSWDHWIHVCFFCICPCSHVLSETHSRQHRIHIYYVFGWLSVKRLT